MPEPVPESPPLGEKQIEPANTADVRPKTMIESLPMQVETSASFFDGPQPHSCYAGILKPKDGEDPNSQRMLRIIPPGRLWPTREDQPIQRQGEMAHDELRAKVLSESYPCLGAKATFIQGTYRMGFYKELAHRASVAAMGADLRRFCREYRELGFFTSFIAVFKRPQISVEDDIESRLWDHLQLMHDHDNHDWDPHYSPDPNDPDFAFSFSGEAFFIVCLHAGASRYSRRSSYVALAFNPESQIRRLKEEGALEAFANKVRARDELLQGHINPSLPVSGATTGGEARVYSGKAHRPGDAWVCPFQPSAAVLRKHRERKSAQADACRDTEN